MDRGAQKRRQSALKIDLKSTNGLYMTTVNPCNDFLVDFLIASKLKSEKQGIGKFTTYNLAIQSVRKYPLPIICQAQLAALQGFGDFFINEAAKRIQKHYKRGRLPNQQQILQDDQEHFQALQANRRKGYKRKKNGEDEEQEDNQEQQQEQYKQGQNQKDKQLQKQKSESIQHKKQTSIQQSKKESKKTKLLERYKPRPDSEPWKILKALYILNGKNKAISKGQINQIFYNWAQGQINIKSWQNCRTRLSQCSYIQFDKKQNDLIRLTDKGYKFILQQLGPDAKKQKQKITNKLQQDSNKVLKVNQSGKLKLIQCQNSQLLNLIVNKQLQFYLHEDQQLAEILTEKGMHKYKGQQCQLGTFLWQIYGKILDYVVIRYVNRTGHKFNKDKLINDCKQARLCQCSHVTIIIEDQQNQQNDQNSDQQSEQQQKTYKNGKNQTQNQYENEDNSLQATILNCRAGGFRVLRYKSIQYTLKYIEQVTTKIKQKLRKINENQGINVIGTLQSINKKISQGKMQAKLYSRCMRLFGINKIAAERMTRLFGTFKLTQQKMRQKFQTGAVRRQFLKKTLGQFQVTDQQIDNIVNFFYAHTYN